MPWKFAPDADISAVKAEIKDEDEPRPPPFPPAHVKAEPVGTADVTAAPPATGGVEGEVDEMPRPPRFAPGERRPPPRIGDDSDEEQVDEAAVAAAASQGPAACAVELARLVFSRGRKAGDQTAQRVATQRYAEKVSSRPRFPRELYILRGLPGIGKTEYAMERLLEMRPLDRGEEQAARFTHVCCVDDFLETFRGQSFKLEAAHRRNEARALLAMEAGIHPVFIDSSNLRLWEMRPYLLLAERLGYVVHFVEPWEICAKRLDGESTGLKECDFSI
ncbi:N4bp2l1 [Symbiodinium pilosum]|uniref:N4bp2l1 protein n=1 Tax=Symbiodinium pilosum TaxID=2952 RepID=A0A812WVJ0_SYMPI|nr:N4bp2l1 [Symbiodinium pilosum]